MGEENEGNEGAMLGGNLAGGEGEVEEAESQEENWQRTQLVMEIHVTGVYFLVVFPYFGRS